MMPISDYSPLVKDVTTFIEKHAQCKRISPINIRDAVGEVDTKVSKKVILRSETYVELGGPEVESTSFVLLSDDTSSNDCVYVVGDDIHSLKKRTVVPFGFVIILHGSELTEEDCERAQETLQTTDWIEGFMVRIRPGSVWGRVSKKSVKKGFGFKDLGSAIIHRAHQTFDKLDAVEVLFVTSSAEEVQQLTVIGNQSRSLIHEIRRRTWAEKGVDIDCPLGGHCGACDEKETCDSVREIARRRKSNLNENARNSKSESCYA